MMQMLYDNPGLRFENAHNGYIFGIDHSGCLYEQCPVKGKGYEGKHSTIRVHVSDKFQLLSTKVTFDELLHDNRQYKILKLDYPDNIMSVAKDIITCINNKIVARTDTVTLDILLVIIGNTAGKVTIKYILKYVLFLVEEIDNEEED